MSDSHEKDKRNKIRMDQVIKDFQGKDMEDEERIKGEGDTIVTRRVPLVLKDLIFSVLNRKIYNENGTEKDALTLEENRLAYLIQTKTFHESGEAEFTISEKSLIEKRAYLLTTPFIAGRIVDAIENIS